jgi:threonine dehydratase
MTTIPSFDKIPSGEELKMVHNAIKPFINYTAVLSHPDINALTGAEVFFKCENFQSIGAFKIRGAAAAALGLSEEQLKNGLTTHSSGNHAQAVAKIAKILGVPAYIVMPDNAPSIKRKSTEAHGAKIIDCKATTADREATLERVVAETGAYFIHPYNDYNVIAGQATAALELMDQVSELDAIFAPIGGGGLMSGTALAIKAFSPKTKAVGTEPKEVDDAFKSLQAGYIIENTSTNTIADGLRTTIREKTFEILRNNLDEIYTVSEEEIIAAMRIVWEKLKITAEPSCVVPFAALLQQKNRFEGQRVGIIITGGNVDLNSLPF